MPNQQPSTSSDSGSVHSDALAPRIACQVCREDVVEADTVALRVCGHRFCVECVTGFLTSKVQEGDVQLKCFHFDAEEVCGAEIDAADVEALLDSDMLAKYHRFVLIRSTPQARTCPYCEHTQITTATSDEPICVCEQCERIFCFTHGNAHAENETCEQYEKRQSRAEKRSGRKVDKISRPCPECTRPIERNGGCAHMTCRVCKAQFCWHCGAKWGFDVSQHNNLWSLDSCEGTAESRALWMDSRNVCVRGFGKTLYYTFLVCVGWPLTLALCWAWIPYTLAKENRAVGRRAYVLARLIAIWTILGIIFGIGLTTILVVEFCEAVFKAGGKGFKKLKQLSRRCCSRVSSPSRTPEKTNNETAFAALHDAGEVV